jgi:peptide/nickel transport system permease protein
MIPTIVVLIILVFLMVRMIPGDPAVTMLGVQATPARVAELRQHMGLDKPWPVQFGLYMVNLLRGDLGNSILVQAPVMDLVKQRLPLTLFLVVYAMVLATIMILPLAVLAALKKDRLVDQIIRGFSILMIVTPGFWIGLILLILIGVKIPIFPVGGAGRSPADWPYYLFLPALTMGLHVAAVLTRNLRDSLLTTMNSEHVLVARAKGLSATRVLLNHVLRKCYGVDRDPLRPLPRLARGRVGDHRIGVRAPGDGEHDDPGDPRSGLSGRAEFHPGVRDPGLAHLPLDRHRLLVRRSARHAILKRREGRIWQRR